MWFGSFGAERDDVFGEDLEELIDESGLFAGFICCGIEGVSPLAQGIDGAFEAESFDGDMVEGCGLLHEGANEVVGDGVHDDFLADHVGGLATENIHAEGDLDISEKQFDGPAAQVEFSDFIGRVADRVDEGGDDDEGMGSEARDGDGDKDLPKGEGLWCATPVCEEAASWALYGFLPDDQTIIWPQSFAVAQVFEARLMQAHDRVHAASQE